MRLIILTLAVIILISPYRALGEKTGGVIDYRFQAKKATTSLVEPHKASTTLATTSTIHRITCYLETGNKTASGKVPKKGMVAVSDRSIKFGTKIVIDGLEYVVEDRTSKRFQTFKTPTIDIFFEGTRADCLKQGVKYKEVVFK